VLSIQGKDAGFDGSVAGLDCGDADGTTVVRRRAAPRMNSMCLTNLGVFMTVLFSGVRKISRALEAHKTEERG
jgi:hypothetical protein